MDFNRDGASGLSSSVLDHVRKRPGMYVGGTDSRALHHLVYEVLDHMVEEAFVGRCNHIWIELRDHNEISIRDNSEGLPTAPYKQTSVTQMEVLLQDLSVSKRDFEPDIYRVTGGLHGLGLAVVNALSVRFTVTNYRDDVLWRKSYENGRSTTPLVRLEDKSNWISGTMFTFTPDFSIFEQNTFEFEKVEKRAREIAFLVSDLTVEIIDHCVNPVVKAVFHYPDGLKTLIKQLNAGCHTFHEPIHIRQEVAIPRGDRPDFKLGVEIAFQFSDGDHTYLRGYINTVEFLDGGVHMTALKSALLSCINEYIEHDMPELERSLTWNEIASGLTAIVSIRHPDPQFASPTKIRLQGDEIYGPIAGLVFKAFNPHRSWDNRSLIEKIVERHLS